MGHVVQTILFNLQLHQGTYKFYIEAALVAVLFYVAVTDFRIFKIPNNVILLLLILYVLFAIVARTTSDIVLSCILSTVTFAGLLWFYSKGVVGAGDVKFVTVACLWVGLHCAVVFSLLLLILIGLHVFAAWMGWVATKPMAGRLAIPYAPSVAGALIAMTLLGCL
jgi:Flp pilus assembly protein protease CpaA